ncbi:WAT1-related protein At1g70260-like [Prunus avium]|uniref:WAT1-related protein At1g70260-like n=1 Tax=Prunus avium TaxID=42229 RepID=A0A6P5TQS0_PRUAV|nr:WAT1-related protein At1g70260-like [Prunus avium]
MWMRSVQLWEALPFSVMVTMEGCTIILTIWAKTVMTVDGMSPFVFVVYTHALSSLMLLLYSFIFHCPRNRGRREQSLFSLNLFVRCFFLGLTGITISQNLGFLGLSYSSPILVCAMGLMIPTFSFLLSIILRRTRLDWRSSSFQAKVSGTIISIIGAVAVEFYKGAYIRTSSVSSSPGKQLPVLAQKALLVFSSEPTEHWVVGGILLASASLSVSVWNIIQLGTMKLHPEVEAMEVVTFYSLLGTIQSAILSLFLERNPSAWRLKLNMELLLIILTAIFGGLVRSRVHNWCMSIKSPYYVPLFKPFGIVFATIFGVSLSANSLHYGSVIGSVVIGMGYFVISWGQIREDEGQQDQQCVDERLEPNSERKVPLLQEENNV